jgi:hypothetical protein
LGFYVLTTNVWDPDNDPSPDNGTTTIVVHNDESGDAYVVGNTSTVNGTPGNGIVTDRYTSSSGITIHSLPDYCFGDPAVADAIVNPQTPLILARIGDSRMAQITTAILQASAPGLPWGGSGFDWSDYPQSWYSSTVYGQAGLTAVDTPYGKLGTLSPIGLHVATLGDGFTGSNQQQSQYFYTTLSFGVNAMYQMVGRVHRYYMLILEGPTGVETSDVRLGIDYVGGNYFSAYFATYAPTQGVKVVYVDVPANHDWASYPTLYPKLLHRPDTVVVSGKTVIMLGGALVTQTQCVCEVQCGVGSRQTASFADETIFSRILWPNYFAKFGSNAGLWIDLGTNGSGNLDTATADKANKILLAQRFRAQFPNGPILFTTAYPGGSGGINGELPGCSKGWRDGSIAAAASLGANTLVFDTYNAMPTAREALALGYYAGGDYVHYSATGVAALAGTISRALRKCAGGKTSAVA